MNQTKDNEVLKMKFNNINNIEELFKVIDKCEGKVELVTGEGDRLNLKSKLTQYVALAKVFAADNDIPEMEVIAHRPEDVDRLVKFMLNGCI